ncbi:TPR-like protein [Peniophora sp. CONT]|nr:TPR-like protein [Peniophora sp. CONT]
MASEEEYSSSSGYDTDETTSSEETDSEYDNQPVAGPSTITPPTIEGEIEGDFDRLVQSIRIGDSDGSSSLLTKDWDLHAEEQDAQFHDDLRAASGIGKVKGRKKRGRKTGPVLSQQVKAMIGEGNQAYIDGDTASAIRLMQEVIRIEPKAASAWSVLANCFTDLGQADRALQTRIMGAHLHHDAEEWELLANESRERGLKQQSLYCLGKVCSLDGERLNAFWDRAFLAKELGQPRIARNSFLAILKYRPHDLTVLEELRNLLIESGELALCAELFTKAFEHHVQTFPYGRDEATDLEGGGFGIMELLALTDMLNTLGAYAQAVHTIRRGVRWLQSRADDKSWDVVEDDREYDLPPGRPDRPGERKSGLWELNINARQRLAISRIKMHDFDEGAVHAAIVLREDPAEYAPLFAEIADAYFESERYEEAKPIYEALTSDATTAVHMLVQVAKCHHMLGELQEAAEVYETVVAADPTSNAAKMRLAEIYEVSGEPRKALDLVYQVIDSRKRKRRDGTKDGAELDEGTAEPEGGSTLFREREARRSARITKKTMTPAMLLKLENERKEEALGWYKRVRDLWPAMMGGQAEGEREWLLEAEKLVEMFRSTRDLFSTGKVFRGMAGQRKGTRRKKVGSDDEAEEDDMASRLQADLDQDKANQRVLKDVEELTEFRGVSFDDWLRLIMQYAFVLTRQGQWELANEVLGHILYSKIIRGNMRDTIRLAIMACAAYAKRFTTVLEQSRRLMYSHQFNNEPLRVLCASLASGLHATDVFIVSTLQKALLREIKLSDAAVHSREKLRFHAVNKRWGIPTGKGNKEDKEDKEDEAEDDVGDAKGVTSELPTKDNPLLVTIYGQISLAAKSYQSALFYLLHAYDYCPDDPMINLCLAVASMGRAMQRQADNRHHLIAQAMAFLTRYRELRSGDSNGLQEVEYNFGRAFQTLGLNSHAVKHYERALELAEARTQADPQDVGLAKETAYNLSIIYVTTGATSLAEALYRRWLSI